MAEFNLPFGVRIANDDPVDFDRYIAANIASRDALVTAGRAYDGLQVYVEDVSSLYILKGASTWEIVGSDSSALAELDASIQTIGVGLNDVSIRVDNQDPSGVYLPLTGGTLTGDLVVDTNVDIGGNLTIDGSVYVVGTETIDVSAAFIHLNTGLTIAPPEYLQSGIVVERGTEDPYVFVFDESAEQFRIGIAPFDGSEYIDSSTQAVATRQNTPLSQGIIYWNASDNRFDTSTGYTLDILTGSTGYIPTYGSPIGQSTLFFSGGILKNYADEDFMIESGYVGNSVGRDLIIRTPDASGNAGDIIIKAGNSDTPNQRGNIVLVPGDQPGQGIIELSDNISANTTLYLIARGAGSNVNIHFTPKGSGNITLGGRTIIGPSNQFDFQYAGVYNQLELKSDKPGLIQVQSENDVLIAQSLTIKGSRGVDASFAGNLYLEGGDAANSGVGGSLVLTPGSGAGGGVDGSIYILNIAEVSTNKVLYYNPSDGAISYQDTPEGGGGTTIDGSANSIPVFNNSENGLIDTNYIIDSGELTIKAGENDNLKIVTGVTGGDLHIKTYNNGSSDFFLDPRNGLINLGKDYAGATMTLAAAGGGTHVDLNLRAKGTSGDVTLQAGDNANVKIGSQYGGSGQLTFNLPQNIISQIGGRDLALAGGAGTISASDGNFLKISGGDAYVTGNGAGGDLILTPGKGNGTGVDGSVYMPYLVDSSTDKILFYNPDSSVITYGDAPSGGTGSTTLAALTDTSIGGLGAAQDGSVLSYNHDETSWTYSAASDPAAGKIPLANYGNTSNATLDLGRDTRAKMTINAPDASIFIDDASLSSEYSHTLVMDITGLSGSYSLNWDPSLSTDNWVDGDVLGIVSSDSVYVVSINTNGNTYDDIVINYVKKGV